MTGPASASQGAQIHNANIVGGLTNLTIWGYGATPSSGPSAFYCERAGSGSDILKLGADTTNKVLFTYRNDAGTLTQLLGASAFFDASGTPHQIAATKQGTALSVYLDGKLDGTATFGSGSDAFTNANVAHLGTDPSGESWTGGSLIACAVWNRALSAAELKWLRAEPYAFIAPPSPRGMRFAVPGTAAAVPTSYGELVW